MGFVYLKLICEVFNFTGNTFILITNCDPESYKLEFNSEYLEIKGFCEYFCKFATILAGWYCAYLGVEIPTVFIGSTGNIYFMASWVATFNAFNFFWVVACGVAMVTRTDVGIAFGEGKIQKAKKLSHMSLILTNIHGLVNWVLSVVFYKQIATLFSSVPTVLEILEPMLLITSFYFYIAGF